MAAEMPLQAFSFLSQELIVGNLSGVSSEDAFRTQESDTGFDVVLPTIAQSCGYSIDCEMNAFDQIVVGDACPVALE
jgi:hypothetical protein